MINRDPFDTIGKYYTHSSGADFTLKYSDDRTMKLFISEEYITDIELDFPTATITTIAASNPAGTVKILHVKPRVTNNFRIKFLQNYKILPNLDQCGQPMLSDGEKSILERSSYSTLSIPGKSEEQCRLRTFTSGRKYIIFFSNPIILLLEGLCHVLKSSFGFGIRNIWIMK